MVPCVARDLTGITRQPNVGVNLVKHELGTGCARAIRAEMTATSFEDIEVGIGIGLNTLNGWYHEICSMEDE